jgi:hypothetical protein
MKQMKHPKRPMRALSFLACLAVAGCEGTSDVGSWRLADRATLREHLRDSDTVVVLIADPAECFTCSAAVGEWATRSSAGAVQLRLILTRKPAAAERTQLAVFRLPVSGILARSVLRPRVQSMEILFVGGVPVMADTLRGNRHSSTVLNWARTRDQSSSRSNP